MLAATTTVQRSNLKSFQNDAPRAEDADNWLKRFKFIKFRQFRLPHQRNKLDIYVPPMTLSNSHTPVNSYYTASHDSSFSRTQSKVPSFLQHKKSFNKKKKIETLKSPTFQAQEQFEIDLDFDIAHTTRENYEQNVRQRLEADIDELLATRGHAGYLLYLAGGCQAGRDTVPVVFIFCSPNKDNFPWIYKTLRERLDTHSIEQRYGILCSIMEGRASLLAKKRSYFSRPLKRGNVPSSSLYTPINVLSDIEPGYIQPLKLPPTGLRLEFKVGSTGASSKCTLGGLITVGCVTYGLTVSHAFEFGGEQNAIHSCGTSSPESITSTSNDSTPSFRDEAFTLINKETSTSNETLSPLITQSDLPVLGSVETVATSTSSDWALIAINRTHSASKAVRHILYTSSQPRPQSENSLGCLKNDEIDIMFKTKSLIDVEIAAGYSGIRSGRLRSPAVFWHFNHRSLRVFAISTGPPLLKGDSGAWVFLKDSYEACGMIVGHLEYPYLALMVTLEDVLNDIQKQLNLKAVSIGKGLVSTAEEEEEDGLTSQDWSTEEEELQTMLTRERRQKSTKLFTALNRKRDEIPLYEELSILCTHIQEIGQIEEVEPINASFKWHRYLELLGCLLVESAVGLWLYATVVAIPAVTAEFNSFNDIGWYGFTFYLAMCASQHLKPQIAQHVPQKIIFLWGFVLFEAGSLLCAVSGSSSMFISGRLLVGLGIPGLLEHSGSKFLSAKSPFIRHKISPIRALKILTTFRRSKTFWWYSRMIVISYIISDISTTVFTIAGPLISGMIFHYPTWRWCFYLSFIFGGIGGHFVFFSDPVLSDPIQRLTSMYDLLGAVSVVDTALAISCITLCCSLIYTGFSDSYMKGPRLLLFGSFLLSLLLAIIRSTLPRASTAFDESSEHNSRRRLRRHAIFPKIVFEKWETIYIYMASVLTLGSLQTVTYWLPVWHQIISGASPSQSRTLIIPFMYVMGITRIVLASTQFDTILRWPLLGWSLICFAQILVGIGAGIVSVHGHSWGSIELIMCGIGFGITSRHEQWIFANISPEQFSFWQTAIFAGNGVFLLLAQCLVNSQFRKELWNVFPDDNQSRLMILSTDATQLHELLPSSLAFEAARMYESAVKRVFYLPASAATLSLFLILLHNRSSLQNIQAWKQKVHWLRECRQRLRNLFYR